jgi:hypothetical protein
MAGVSPGVRIPWRVDLMRFWWATGLESGLYSLYKTGPVW